MRARNISSFKYESHLIHSFIYVLEQQTKTNYKMRRSKGGLRQTDKQ